MSIKTYRPTTPARRHMTVSGFDGVDKHAKPEKSLLEVKKRHAGRNGTGRITVRQQGGGNRQKYRVIDFKRNKLDVSAKVLRLEYDPNRSAFIALCEYEDGERRYILAPVGLSIGDTILSSVSADIKPGNALPLANIPVGTVIHNIELYPGKGAQLVRCPRANTARSVWSAWRPSARSATSITPTFTSAKPAANATWAFARRSAAPS